MNLLPQLGLFCTYELENEILMMTDIWIVWDSDLSPFFMRSYDEAVNK